MSDENSKKENDIFNTLFDKALSFKLSDEEREAMSRKFIFETVSPFVTPRTRMVVYPQHSSSWYHFFESKKVLAGVFVFVLCLGLGGTSFAARHAIPGDALYPIKIHLNEGAETFFSIGEKSLAKTYAVHALARLEEVEKLALKDKLNATTTTLAKAQFAQDANNVTQGVEKLNKEGDAPAATEVGTNFELSLQDHRGILNTLSEKGGNQKQLLSDLAGTVTTHLYATAAVNLNIELGINATNTNATSTGVGTTTPAGTGTSTPASNATSTPTTATSTPTGTTSPEIIPGSNGTTTEPNASTTQASTSANAKIVPISGAKVLKAKTN